MRAGTSSGTIFDTGWTEWVEGDGWRKSLDAVPMVPAVARDVLSLATEINVSAKRILSVVSKDPVLASRVLRLANSAFSASAVPITSINAAIVRMGTESVRNVITAVCVASILTDDGRRGDEGRDLVDHGVGTAYIASFIAEAAGEPRDQAFACGLLHDIGKLLIRHLAARPDHGVRRPTPEELAAVMADRHAEFGGVLLKLWNLPEPLHDAVANHHHVERALQSRPTAVTYVANRLAHRYGFGCQTDEADLIGDPVFAVVNVDAPMLARIDKHAPMMFEVARQLTSL
jgi:putative nucleotidyltransferase with HDIG domain